MKKFCESNSIEEVILDKKRSGRLKSVRSPEVICTVKQFIEVSTKISIEKRLSKFCAEARCRFEAVIEVDGGYFE